MRATEDGRWVAVAKTEYLKRTYRSPFEIPGGLSKRDCQTVYGAMSPRQDWYLDYTWKTCDFCSTVVGESLGLKDFASYPGAATRPARR